MYRCVAPGQLSFEEFYLPFSGTLSEDNRWVKLAKWMPWEAFEEEYASQFSQDTGAPAKSFRMALGALIIKERLGTSDRETVEQIRENPYLQYFLGLSEYSNQAPFDASMMVHFRQRLSLEFVGRVNETVVAQLFEQSLVESDKPASAGSDAKAAKDGEVPTPTTNNRGQLEAEYIYMATTSLC